MRVVAVADDDGAVGDDESGEGDEQHGERPLAAQRRAQRRKAVLGERGGQRGERGGGRQRGGQRVRVVELLEEVAAERERDPHGVRLAERQARRAGDSGANVVRADGGARAAAREPRGARAATAARARGHHDREERERRDGRERVGVVQEVVEEVGRREREQHGVCQRVGRRCVRVQPADEEEKEIRRGERRQQVETAQVGERAPRRRAGEPDGGSDPGGLREDVQAGHVGGSHSRNWPAQPRLVDVEGLVHVCLGCVSREECVEDEEHCAPAPRARNPSSTAGCGHAVDVR